MGQIDAFMDNSVEKRLKYLDNLVTSTSYSRRKSAIEKKFEKCLINLNPVKSMLTATPADVRRFLVQKDAKGKTQSHELSCRFLGKSGVYPCQCPHRVASGTVQSILGKLKSIFENLVGGPTGINFKL